MEQNPVLFRKSEIEAPLNWTEHNEYHDFHAEEIW